MISLFRRKKTAPVEEPKKKSAVEKLSEKRKRHERVIPKDIEWRQPTVTGAAMDGKITRNTVGKHLTDVGVSPQQLEWAMCQNFIGYPLMALLGKHWLIDKACSMPARDAIRQGYSIDCKHSEVIEKLTSLDKEYKVNDTMKTLVTQGRVFGGAAVLFLVDSDNADYYENPFNPDGVTKDSYKGMKVIDAMHMHPMLDAGNVQDPASPDYMRPRYWQIGGKRYHHTHFMLYSPYPVADVAKPTYNYFGVSVPERIFERVFNSERSANEVPELIKTKRLGVVEIPDLEEMDIEGVFEQFEQLRIFVDNFSTLLLPQGSNYSRHESALADLDANIMTQYQLVAAAANVPATKLLGTTPKGFNSTGDYEESVYREELESVQTNDLEPLLLRHYEILNRSLGQGEHTVKISWQPLDSPTAKEYAEINNSKAQTAKTLFDTGAIDGYDIREQLRNDKDSDFFALDEKDADELEPPETGGGMFGF